MSASFFGSRSTSSLARDDSEGITWNSSSASSSLNKSFGPVSSKKADYIPSGYIQQQLALEEACRQEEGDISASSLLEQDRSLSSSGRNGKKLGASAWHTADQVLTQKFSSGPLGYDVPREGSDYATLRRAEIEAESAAAARTAVHFSESTGAGASTEEVKSPRLYPDLRTSVSSLSNKGAATGTDTIPGSPITTLKPAFQKDSQAEEKLRRRSSVRFADVDSARESSGANGNKDVIDILTRATAPLGHDTLNTSLGPALGAVGGRQSTSAGWSSLSDADKLSTGAGTGTKQTTRSSENRPNAIFPEKEDLLARQQEVALAEQANKERQSRSKKGDDEDDNKDTPHYLPGYLLDSFSGAKAAKVEPFVDEKADLEWTNTETQSNVRPALMNEDAPPAETLDTLARKEGLYTRSIPTFSSAQSFLQDTRMDDVQMNEAPTLLPQSIIIYGFSPETSSYMLNQFRSFGAVQFYKTGYYLVKGTSVNWMKIRYQDQSGVKRAVANHLKTLGGFRVGVSLCPSFDSFVEKHDQSFGDFNESQDCTAEEQQSMEAGLNALNALQRSEISAGQDQVLGSSQLRPAPMIHHPRPLDASRSAWAPQQSQFRQSGYYQSVQSSGTSKQDDDEDLRSILGHSITSGGSLLRPQRPASADGFLRSTNIHSYSTRHGDMQGHDFQSSPAGMNHSVFGASRTISPADSGVSLRMQTDSPTGFTPLFGVSTSSSASMSPAAPLRSGRFPTTATPSSSSPDQVPSSALSPLPVSSSPVFGQPQAFSTEPLMRRTHNQSMLGSSPLRTSGLSRSHSTGGGIGVVRAGEDLQGLHTQKRARLSRTQNSTPTPMTHFTTSGQRSSSQVSAPAASSSIFGGSLGHSTHGVRSPSFRTPQERSKFLADGDAEEKRQEQLLQQRQNGTNGGSGGMWGSIVDMAKRNLFWG